MDNPEHALKQLILSPPIFLHTQTWLEDITLSLFCAFSQQIKNITVCKMMSNGYVEWCKSLDKNNCHCDQMCESYCCQKWMKGEIGLKQVGHVIYHVEYPKQPLMLGCILYTDNATARAMVVQFNDDSIISDSLIEQFNIFFKIISQQLTNHMFQAEHLVLETILREAGDSVELTDMNAVVEYVNPAFEKITGYTLKQAQGKTVAELMRRSNMDTQFYDNIANDLSQGKTWKGTLYSKRKDGQEWVAQAVIIPIKNRKNEVVKHLAIKQDITEQYRKQQVVVENEKRYRGIMDAAFDGIVIHDLQGRIRQVNRAICDSLGYGENDLVGANVGIIEKKLDGSSLAELWQKLLQQDMVVEGRHQRKDGTQFPVEVRLSSLEMDGDKLIIAMVKDISRAKEYQEKLIRKANYDDLTELPNRAFGVKTLALTIEKARNHNDEVTVLFLDLDNFKQVNDSMGHFAGDQLLINFSKRLKRLIRTKDFVARLSGDEFMVIISNVQSSEKLMRMVERMQLAFSQPFIIEGKKIHVSASIGVAQYPYDGDDSETLLRNADIAMYKSKTSGRGRWKVFQPDMVKSAVHNLHFETAFRQALNEGAFNVHFQPIIDCVTGELKSFEALLRWYDRDMGHVNPEHVIGFAEQIGLAEPLSRWILATVCQEAKRCYEVYGVAAKMSVNISAQQINRTNFVEEFIGVLQENYFKPQDLIIEVTESTLLEGKDHVCQQLNHLKELGVSIAIDDFGVGYSSLSYLKDFPFSCLKIDKSFIKHLTDDDSYENLVNSIISMAHCMNLKVVSEGVETEGQALLLNKLGCDYLQGWLIAKALPFEHIEEWLKSRY